MENKPASLLVVSLGKALTGRLHLYVADRWPTRTSPDYNCEVACPACRKRRLLGNHQWQFALLVVGLPVTEYWFQMDCHVSPSLISIRLTACRTSIPRKRRGNHKQTTIPVLCASSWRAVDLKKQKTEHNSNDDVDDQLKTGK